MNLNDQTDKNKSFSDMLVSQIKAERKKRNLTQVELAMKIDMSPIIYSHVESGRRELKILELVRILKLFEIDISKFVNHCLVDDLLYYETEYRYIEGRYFQMPPFKLFKVKSAKVQKTKDSSVLSMQTVDYEFNNGELNINYQGHQIVDLDIDISSFEITRKKFISILETYF